MKVFLVSLITLMFFNAVDKEGNIESTSKLYDLYAGPFGKFGAEKKVYSVFGENVGCKISIVENNAGGVISLKVHSSEDNKWKEYIEGTYIKGQVIKVKASCVSTRGMIRIKEE